MINKSPAILVYGFGNPGRQDDSLGIELVDEFEKWCKNMKLTNVIFDQNYQLNIEDAEKISNFDLVIFADASVENIESYTFEEVQPVLKSDFTMHSVTPSFVLGLCHQIFNKFPRTFQLQIKGYKWEFMEQSTDTARSNLKEAIKFLKIYFTEHHSMYELT